jgi:hypothetical protein
MSKSRPEPGSRGNLPGEPAPTNRVAVPEAGSLQVPSPVFGRPTTYHCGESVEQALAVSDFPRLTSLLANLDPDPGTAREFGGGLLWEHDSRFSALSLTIAPEGARTMIRADLNLGGRLFAYYGAAVAAAGFTALVATNYAPGVQAAAIGAAALLPLGLAARMLWNASARRSAVALRRLVDQLAAALRGDLS